MPVLLRTDSLQVQGVCSLGISSLALTAYMSVFASNAEPQLEGLGKSFMMKQGPIPKHAGVLNGVLSLLAVLNMYFLKGKSGVPEGFWLHCALPACKIILLFHRLFISFKSSRLLGFHNGEANHVLRRC